MAKMTTIVSALEKPKRVKTTPGEALRGHVHRAPLTSRGGAWVAVSPPPPAHWSSPVY